MGLQTEGERLLPDGTVARVNNARTDLRLARPPSAFANPLLPPPPPLLPLLPPPLRQVTAALVAEASSVADSPPCVASFVPLGLCFWWN